MKGYPIFYHKRIMGIRNRDGALYIATGLDNSGMYEGTREAMGIIKTLAGEITSFDVFGGIGDGVRQGRKELIRLREGVPEEHAGSSDHFHAGNG